MFRGRKFEKLRYKYYNDHGKDPETNHDKIIARPKIEVAFYQSNSITISGDNIVDVVNLLNAVTRKFYSTYPAAKIII